MDYEKAYIPEGCLFYEFLCKRGSYRHENELRALFLKGYDTNKFSDNDIRGTNVVADLIKLIDKIVLCHDASDEFITNVKSEIKKYRFEFEVVKSELDKQPIF